MDFQFLFGDLGHRTSAFPLVGLGVFVCCLALCTLRKSISGYKFATNIQGVSKRAENWGSLEESSLKIILRVCQARRLGRTRCIMMRNWTVALMEF